MVIELPGPSSFAGGRTVTPDAPQIAALTNRTRALLAEAKAIGISPGLIIVPNQGYDAGGGKSPVPYTPFPDPEHVRGNLGALTCAAAGHQYVTQTLAILSLYFGITFFTFDVVAARFPSPILLAP